MSNYFRNFQKTLYTLETDNTDIRLVTNILNRSTFLREVAENISLFYPYDVQEYDTPEIIADKLYGDSGRHWIVLLFNIIMNPYYTFPMNQRVLGEFIMTKYGITLEEATQVIHSYEREETRKVTAFTGSSYAISETTSTIAINEYEVDPTTGYRNARTDLPVTADTVIELPSEIHVIIPGQQTLEISARNRALSIYTYEDRVNEKNKAIKLLDARYVSQVEKEFKRLMNGK